MQSIATRKKPSRAHILTAVIIAAVYALVFAAEQLLPASSMLFIVLKKGATYALVAVSMNLLNGFTGIFSLGQAGFMLLGAYTFAIFTIPEESREIVYQYYNGGLIRFALPVIPALVLSGLVAALFGVLPNTSFSQNVGLVTMTKVVNRGALSVGAIFLILCGLIPKLGAIVSIMPQSVLGGAAVMMFSSIVISGIQLITKEEMTPRNLTIVSVALGVGYGMGANMTILAQAPQAVQLIFGGSGIVPAAFVAILLNIVLPKDKKTEA